MLPPRNPSKQQKQFAQTVENTENSPLLYKDSKVLIDNFVKDDKFQPNLSFKNDS